MVAVITGASAGVGRAAAIRFAQEGATVALLARGRAGLEAAAKDVESAGGKSLIYEVDVTDVERIESVAQQIVDECGRIDVWVNCAFSSVFAKFMEVEPDEFRRALDVTYMGFVNGTRAALRHMTPRGNGTVVQVGSALAYRGIPLQAGYCAAKHAIQGFTESVRTELLSDGSNVRITSVHIPGTNTPQFDWVLSRLDRKPQPVPPIYSPFIAADAIYEATQQYRREWFVTSTTARTIIGNKLIPGLLDRYLGRKGVVSQLTNEPLPTNSPSNLYRPLDENEDWGAEGRFSTRQRNYSVQWTLTKHRRVAWAVGLGSIAAGIAGLTKRR